MADTSTPARTPNAWRAAVWATICAGLAIGALVLSLGSASAALLPAPLGPCSGPSCPATFPPSNNGDFTGRDDTINVFAGGTMTVTGRAAEAEGKVVVLGDMTVDKDGGGAYNVGVAGVGSRVPPSNGTDFLTVGGDLTVNPGNTMLVGGSDSTQQAWGNVRHAGTATGTITIDPPGQLIHDPAAADPYLDLRPRLGTMTACYATQKATGTVTNEFGTATFRGDGTSMLQVFNVNEPLGTADGQIGLVFENIPEGATVLVNLLGDNAFINTYTGGGSFDTTNALGPKLLWNAPTATTITVKGTAQFQGSIMAGNPASTTTVSVPGVDGRTYVAGDLVHTGTAGTEFHAYPFNGDMPDCGMTPTATPTTSTTTATPTATATATTAMPTPTMTITNNGTPTDMPTTVAPTTVAPTTVAPTTAAPTTAAPTTTAPTTAAPTSMAPTPTPTMTTAMPTTTASGPTGSPKPSRTSGGGNGGGDHLATTGIGSGELLFFAIALPTVLLLGLGFRRFAHRGFGRRH